MDPKTAEKTIVPSNMNSVDIVPNFQNYKFANHIVHQPAQPIIYTKPNNVSADYQNCNGTMIDINNNYGTNAYGASLHYYNESGLISNNNTNINNNNNTNNNNNNNISFPNQNYKIASKYAFGGNTLPPQCAGMNMMNPGSVVNTTACQYAHTYGGASCFNRNRYMPYNHNRACAAAAIQAIGINSRTSSYPFGNNTKMSAAISTVGNNITVVPPLLYSSYQQCPTNYPNFIPYMSQPANMTVPHINLDSTNHYLMAAYEHGMPPTAPVDFNRYSFSMPPNSNFVRTNRVAEPEGVTTCGNIQKSQTFNISFTSAPCSSTAGAVVSTTSSNPTYASVTDLNQAVSLRLTNLDYTMDEESLRKFLLAQLKPITPVVSLTFEDSNFATVTVPDSYFAKQVVANLHRKKIGHKRMVVSYTRDSSLTESTTLRCQVAGLLKDVPYNRLPMYKFRELFQSRFKTSISVLDLYTMRDICIISTDGNEEKYITLLPNLVNSLESSPLMEGLQHTVPYCKEHFKREQHKGWAEQEIEPLPNVFMTICEIQNIVYSLLKAHNGDIPVSSLIHCIEGQMQIRIESNDSGVNLEHLVCCIQGIKIQTNNFGIKILDWLESDRKSASGGSSTCSVTGQNNNNNTNSNSSSSERGLYFKSADPLCQITREVIELVKMSPKSTMKFSRFIPAYHNHFGKQCRVADYGYTKLIELFEALSTVIQIMGDGENRQITLTHRTQIRRFTSDLLRILRSTGNKSVMLSELPQLFAKAQNRNFDITDYGVCELGDILDGLVHSNVVVVTKMQNGKDILISIPKRQQTSAEIAKTCVFAGEMVELFANAPQYTVLFQKFVRSYHYHFAYQCRLSDYGFLKLADLMEAIHGVVEMDRTNDEDRRIFLSPIIARRVFAEQSEELIRIATGSSKTSLKLKEVLKLHKKKYGYQMQPETLGVEKIEKAIELLPYVETFKENEETWITCHNHDPIFRTLCYRACKHLLAYDPNKYRPGGVSKILTDINGNVEHKRKPPPSLSDFIIEFNAKYKENLNVNMVKAMRYAIEIFTENSNRCVRISEFMSFVINIVRLLEQRSLLLLNEIKSTMNCTINTTFPYGYPNLFTLLTSYPDIFIVNMGVSQESSEVRLAPNCEFISQRTFTTVQKSVVTNVEQLNSTKPLNTKINATRPSRPPLSDLNGRNSDGPPSAKIRHIMSNEIQNASDEFKNPNYSSNLCQQPNADFITALALPNPNNVYSLSSGFNSYGVAGSYASCHNSTLLNSSLSSVSGVANKENSFSSSFNVSFDSSNNSFIDLNGSLSGTNSMHMSSTINSSGFNQNTSQLWERRQDLRVPLRQDYSSMHRNISKGNSTIINPQTLAPLIIPKINSNSIETPLISQSSLYKIINNIQNGPPGTPLCGVCPPKPDSPPTNNVPFWLDPIWSHEAKSQTNILPNTKLSDPKAPMVLSPYTLSKIVNLNREFNFESLDRKIT